jgi:hypothetical protein
MFLINSNDRTDEKMPLKVKLGEFTEDENTDESFQGKNLLIKGLGIEKKNQSSGAHGTYGSFVAYCFCVNYILGVGVLGVP